MALRASLFWCSCYLASVNASIFLCLSCHLIMFVWNAYSSIHGDREGISFGKISNLVSVCPLYFCTLFLCHFDAYRNLDISRHWQRSYAILFGISSDLSYEAWVSQLLLLTVSFFFCLLSLGLLRSVTSSFHGAALFVLTLEVSLFQGLY